MTAPAREDWILWAQLGCALVATAHAEYTLVTALGQHWIVAGAVTGALDLYVVRALQKHKDVLPAVLVMVAANVVSILIHHRVVPVHWAVLAAVGALAPLLVWRGHRLRVHASAEASAVSALDSDAPEPAPVLNWGPAYQALSPSAPGPCAFSEPFLRPLDDECSNCGYFWGAHPGVQEKRARHAAKYPESPTSAEYLGTSDMYSQTSAIPYLAPVPDLPAEYATSAVHEEAECALEASDWDFLERAQAYVKASDRATVKGLRRELKIGQERAERLLAYLGVRP